MTIPARQADTWVFVDTGAYFALTFTGDENHQAARSIYAELATQRRQLVTTNFVLAETHALLLNRLEGLSPCASWRVSTRVARGSFGSLPPTNDWPGRFSDGISTRTSR